MKVLIDVDSCRREVVCMRRAGKTVGLVPTMGALHEGHTSLIRASIERCDATAVTIFVNPTQFGPGEDYDSYPRTIDADLSICEALGVDLVFVPPVDAMVLHDAATVVRVNRMTSVLCGAHRPGHFDGVTTIVLKLFHILPADSAFFGEKDYQQMIVIRRMANDLNIPIRIVGCPTVREADGLALSSRNVHLSPAQREQAVVISQALFRARQRVDAGERSAAVIEQAVREEILAAGPGRIDYVQVVDAHSLEPLTTIDRAARLCVAAHIGPCRLIDNLAVDPPLVGG